MSNIALATTIHDPEARFLEKIEKYLPTIKLVCPDIAIASTFITNSATKQILIDNQVRLIETLENRIGASRRKALELALTYGKPSVLYCDFDRMLHWAAAYPSELTSLHEWTSHYDYLVIGRTQRAFNTHPAAQRETEAITNRVFFSSFRYNCDVTTGTSVMTQKAVQAILAHSRADSNATDTEWPLIVLRFVSDKIGCIEVEGMEFETADFYEDKIAEFPSYEEWLESLSSDPRRWLPRLRLTMESLESMLPFLD
jgi:hypothetical protein